MSFFQLRATEGNSWPLIPDSKVGHIWATYLLLGQTQWLSPADIERNQLAQVRTLLTHCRKNVPYFRDLLTQLDLDPSSIQTMNDFRRVPLLNRRSWQEHSDRLTAEVLPQGITPMNEISSSGTTGTPVKVLKTSICQAWWLGFYLRTLEWLNVDIRGTLAVLRPSNTKGEELQKHLQGVQQSSWLPVLDPLLVSGPVFSMDIQQHLRRQIQWLHEVNPNYILSYPSNAEALAGILLDQPRRLPRLRSIQLISETLTDEAKAKIETAFGVPVHNIYSCTEAGYVATPCPQQSQGFHVHSENVILEVLNESGQPCGPGETGRVALTDLHNSRSPVIRYEIGDEVTLAETNCPCGRGLPLLARISGKQRPMLRLKNGRLKQSTTLAIALSSLGGHYQHQFIQKTLDQVVVRMVPNKSWTPDHPKQLLKLLQEFFESPLHLHLELRDRLEVPPNGKLLSIITEVKD